ncbi:MAG: hypothetical protein J07HQW1_03006 [Haloquadratum walsbyi J07HQW1]|jgi:amino acid/amide ABC transporter membrane protein 1, HAAT family (TC 3.A.1.4.-)|uniref:Branched-chain amino acid ABC-type transport system, permease component n=1 Tax=Haloquadratum walsbyi J07HQW1 TaxID=1238424 RepID=U1MS35_9EURY|nr:MAG: hypothetical protein J07HQW1_03006 [Haloquadratum walsbyi J07HQW1]
MGIAETYTRGRRFAVTRPGSILLAIVGFILLFDLAGQLTSGQITFSSVGSLIWDGLMRGLVIGLAGIGLSMTYSILNFANFAHGDYITAGAFSGWATTYLIAGLGRADVGALLLVGAGGSVFGGTLGLMSPERPLRLLQVLLLLELRQLD